MKYAASAHASLAPFASEPMTSRQQPLLQAVAAVAEPQKLVAAVAEPLWQAAAAVAGPLPHSTTRACMH